MSLMRKLMSPAQFEHVVSEMSFGIINETEFRRSLAKTERLADQDEFTITIDYACARAHLFSREFEGALVSFKKLRQKLD